jgi:hypothetical protein
VGEVTDQGWEIVNEKPHHRFDWKIESGEFVCYKDGVPTIHAREVVEQIFGKEIVADALKDGTL